MKLQELLQGVVCWKALDAIIGNAMLSPALRTLDLPFDIVDQALHARLHTVGVLAWQQLGCPVSVQADTAGEELVKLVHDEDVHDGLVTGFY
jgi:hypothetical protein